MPTAIRKGSTVNFLCNGSSHGGSVHRVGSGPHVPHLLGKSLARAMWLLDPFAVHTDRPRGEVGFGFGKSFEAAYRLGPRDTDFFDTYLGAENGQHYLRRSSKSFIQSRGWNHEIGDSPECVV